MKWRAGNKPDWYQKIAGVQSSLAGGMNPHNLMSTDVDNKIDAFVALIAKNIP